MKRGFLIFLAFGLALASTNFVWAGKSSKCVAIQDGTLTYSAGHYLEGEPIPLGFDEYGSNYQAHMFSGSYFNNYAGRAGFPPYEGDDEAYLAENPTAANHWAWPYRDIEVMMKWSDEWLSNKDCNGDGKLDRGYKCDPIIADNSGCPGAWLTNHQSGGKGKDHWVYFCKIVAPPEGAYKDGKIWYTADGVEIGPEIWGAFATIQEVESGEGATYVSPAGPGFGKFK